MNAAVDRMSNGSSADGGGAGAACGGPESPKNKPRNLRSLRSVAWMAALGLLSRVPAASAGIFPYDGMNLEVSRLSQEARGIHERELLSLPDAHS